MSRLMTYFEAALQGLSRYFEANKLVVLLLAILLAWWLVDKKPREIKGKMILLYTLVMSVVLLFPITALFVMIYQTGYYDYEWAWSMVPLTAVLAYGAVLLIERGGQQAKKFWSILIIAAVLCLCGNQGALLTIEGEDAAAQENTVEVLQEIYDFGIGNQCMLWAPKNIMEQVRRQDGKILLIYGRDMWDVKAGAYDYEAYSEELTKAYVWLENMEGQAEVASIMADPMASFRILCDEVDLNADRKTHLRTVLQSGANVLVLPHLVAEHIEESILTLADEMQKTIKNTYTEEYTIYMLE